MTVVERDVRPKGVWRVPRRGRDGLLRRQGLVVSRLLHFEDDPVVVRAWPVGDAVRLRAEGGTRAGAAYGIERMRFALALDHDLAPFQRAFRRDPLIGRVVRAKPWLRPGRMPEPFEALAWAITEQLIEVPRALAIQRRLVRRFGRPRPDLGLVDSPAARTFGGRSPAELEACDLSHGRSLALIACARQVARGHCDLSLHEPAWRRLRRVRGIGSWTLEKLALHGQGRDDQLPAGDLAYVKLVGRLEGLGRRATEHEVRAWFDRYAPFQALAGLYLLHAKPALPPPWLPSTEVGGESVRRASRAQRPFEPTTRPPPTERATAPAESGS